MTPKKLDLTKLTLEHFTKQPNTNCDHWKTYKSTKSKKVKLEKVIRNKFWLWENLDPKYFSQFTKFLKAHSNKCVYCNEELNKKNLDEQDTRMCENCSSKMDYCKVCDEHSYDDYGVNCTHKVWNDTIGGYSGTGDSETDDKYYRRSLWELCEAMSTNFAKDLLVATVAIDSDLDSIFKSDYEEREIIVGSNIYKIPTSDAVQYGFDWIATLPQNYIGTTDKSFEARCKAVLQKTTKWLIEYISLTNDNCYEKNKYTYPYRNNYGDFNLVGQDTNYPFYTELLADINSILGKKEEDYFCPYLDNAVIDILKSSRKKIVYTITRHSIFEWELLVTKANGNFITRKIERNKIRCQAQLIHFLKGKKDNANQT